MEPGKWGELVTGGDFKSPAGLFVGDDKFALCTVTKQVQADWMEHRLVPLAVVGGCSLRRLRLFRARC
jgi:hypothetical protein